MHLVLFMSWLGHVIAKDEGKMLFHTKYAITMETVDSYQTKDLTYLCKCVLVFL